MGKWIGMFLIKAYWASRKTVFCWIPSTCRFSPTCSQYTYQAIQKYGLMKGSWMGVRRVLRCHPLHPGGYDPVP